MFLCSFVCLRACVRACVRASVCVCVCVRECVCSCVGLRGGGTVGSLNKQYVTTQCDVRHRNYEMTFAMRNEDNTFHRMYR